MAANITLGAGMLQLDYGAYTLKTRGKRFRVAPLDHGHDELLARGRHHTFDPFLNLGWLRRMVLSAPSVELVEIVELQGVKPDRFVLHMHDGKLFCLVERA